MFDHLPLLSLAGDYLATRAITSMANLAGYGYNWTAEMMQQANTMTIALPVARHFTQSG